VTSPLPSRAGGGGVTPHLSFSPRICVTFNLLPHLSRSRLFCRAAHAGFRLLHRIPGTGRELGTITDNEAGVSVRPILGALTVCAALLAVPGLADNKHDTNRNRRAVPCPALLNLHLDNTTITTAKTVPAGLFDPPGETPPFTDLSEFCRVVGMITPVANSQIGFESGCWPTGTAVQS
jgi:hypothetical protein